MSITFTGTGGLFTRLGRVGGWIKSINSYRGNSGTSGTHAANIQAQFQSTDQDVTHDLWDLLATLQNSLDGSESSLQTLTQNIEVRMVQDDTGIEDTSLLASMTEIIRQMEISSDKVEAPTVTATVTAGNGVLSNTGDGVCIATVYNEKNIQMDYVFAETVTGVCTLDAQAVSGGATQGKEPFTFEGEALVDPLGPLYPLGSGCVTDISAVTADDDATQTSNLLTNGDWESWTSNNPANWVIDIGTAGTSIKKYTASPYRGTGALEIVGDGAEFTSLYESFNTSGQTTGKVAPLTVYGINTWIKCSATPAAGVLEIALTDGNGTILTDESGAQLKITQSLTTVSTTWVPVNGFLRTPRALPATARFRVRLSTALSSGKSLYIDDTVIQQADQLYNGGGFVAVFSGKIPFIVGDTFRVAFTNTYSSEWQLMAERMNGMRDLGLQLPSTTTSGSVTISDSLIA